MTTTRLPVDVPLSSVRLAGLRGAYLLLGLGLAIAKWPLLPQGHTMPLYEGVTLCFLTALSVLALPKPSKDPWTQTPGASPSAAHWLSRSPLLCRGATS